MTLGIGFSNIQKSVRRVPLRAFVFGSMRIQRTPPTVSSAVASLYMFGVTGSFTVIILALSIFFFHISASVINDLGDLEADRINAPARPLPRGTMSRITFLGLGASFFLLGLGLALWLSPAYFWLCATLGASFIASYSFGYPMKNNVFGSFFYVALAGMPSPFFAGAVIADRVSWWFLGLCFYLGVLSSCAYISSLRDLSGDERAGKATLAVRLGLARAHKFALLVVLLPIMLLWIPVVFLGFSPNYVLYSMPPILMRLTLAVIVLRREVNARADLAGLLYRSVLGMEAWSLALAKPASL